jgi:hypothetical protein
MADSNVDPVGGWHFHGSNGAVAFNFARTVFSASGETDEANSRKQKRGNKNKQNKTKPVA